jgi:integrase
MKTDSTRAAGKRRYGNGTVEPFRGRWRARAARQPDGRRPVLAVCDTEPEAEKVLLDVAALAAEAVLADGARMTLRGWGPRFLDARELGARDGLPPGVDAPTTVKTDRSRWLHHIASAPFYDYPVEAVETADIRELMNSLAGKQALNVRAEDPEKRRAVYRRKKRKLAAQTRKHVLNLLRKAFDELIEAGHIPSKVNPCAGVKAPKIAPADFAWLDMDEQDKIVACDWLPNRAGEHAGLRGEADKLRAMFAWGTAVRQFDQWCMKLTDVRGLDTDAPDIYFWCHKKKAKVSVPLLGIALRAVKRQLEILPAYSPKNPKGLLFPLPSGARRGRGKDYGWHKLLEAAGISKWVTWHELRDTCATSLLNGWWGRRWQLHEVRDMLTHSGIEVTERYAHLTKGTLARAARNTTGRARVKPFLGDGQFSSPIGHHAKGPDSKSPVKSGRARQDSDLRPTAPEALTIGNDLITLSPLDGQLMANLARTVVMAGQAGDARFARLALELAGAVLERVDLAASATPPNVVRLSARRR